MPSDRTTGRTPAAHQQDDDDGADQQREGEEDVGDTHDHRVDEPAEVPGQGTQDDADRAGDEDGRHTDDHRDPAAVDETRQLVPAERVGAEEVVPSRCLKRVGEILLERIERRQKRCEDRDDHQDDQDDEADDRELVGEEAGTDV